jgi:hypothetical protein
MKPRKTALALAAAAAIAVTTGLNAAPAFASSPPICSTNGVYSNSCLNRDGGGTRAGTPIIAWYNNGDPNNDFAYVWLTTYCGFGQVSTICPFSNHSYDQRYFGDRIYELAAVNVPGNMCVAEGDYYINVILNTCGSDGYVFVRSALGYLVDVGATNSGPNIEWLYTNSIGNQDHFAAEAETVWTGP